MWFVSQLEDFRRSLQWLCDCCFYSRLLLQRNSFTCSEGLLVLVVVLHLNCRAHTACAALATGTRIHRAALATGTLYAAV